MKQAAATDEDAEFFATSSDFDEQLKGYLNTVDSDKTAALQHLAAAERIVARDIASIRRLVQVRGRLNERQKARLGVLEVEFPVLFKLWKEWAENGGWPTDAAKLMIDAYEAATGKPMSESLKGFAYLES